ncbi:hypothetical protein SARC_01372 [Sphaeroforma arctica JP610]|uniref:Uncharacterized protein n=1 Tax=Sphaeroforma arctica JP610 TaxID=667725 RepID=A0A0L0GC65_9EUKA|nr:hypothetical protein SARC_01372 [Sphaeroforma arctica JP610]KNC86501.1 hypothetical protein SARC_01372 [Sphaeroforma arctica JP610]|eukprot:XP_014160403.1 hypothetical protein SARC_01372 [Sphaeroforma arctica JP610]
MTDKALCATLTPIALCDLLDDWHSTDPEQLTAAQRASRATAQTSVTVFDESINSFQQFSDSSNVSFDDGLNSPEDLSDHTADFDCPNPEFVFARSATTDDLTTITLFELPTLLNTTLPGSIKQAQKSPACSQRAAWSQEATSRDTEDEDIHSQDDEEVETDQTPKGKDSASTETASVADLKAMFAEYTASTQDELLSLRTQLATMFTATKIVLTMS